MPVLESASEFACSLEGLFDFLSRPRNVSLVTDPGLGLSFTSAPDVLHAGAQLDFQIITFGQIIKSRHAIVDFERPRLVVEQQVTGPMKSWTHRHEYVPFDGGVRKLDRIEFQLPGGLIGLLLSEQKVRDHLEDGFFLRDQRLRDLIARGEIA